MIKTLTMLNKSEAAGGGDKNVSGRLWFRATF